MFTLPKKYSYSLDVARQIYSPSYPPFLKYSATMRLGRIGDPTSQFSPGPNKILAGIGHGLQTNHCLYKHAERDIFRVQNINPNGLFISEIKSGRRALTPFDTIDVLNIIFKEEDLVLLIPMPMDKTYLPTNYEKMVDEWLKNAFYNQALFGVPVYDMAVLDDVPSLPTGSKLAVIQFMSKELFEQLSRL